MDPWEVMAPALRTIAASVFESVVDRVADSGAGSGGRWSSRRARAPRRERYRRMEMALTRARLRVDMLHTLHRQRQSLANLELLVAGVRTALAAVEALRTDLTVVLEAVTEIRDESSRTVSLRADNAVEALTVAMTCLDPGWWHPRQRRRYSAERTEAFENYDAALRLFRLVAQADAAATWRERRAARKALKSVSA